MSFFIISFIVCFFINIVVSYVIGILIPDYYLAQIITSVLIAFIYSIFVTPDKRSFYKNRNFWILFLGMSIFFLLLDCLSFLML